MVNDSLLTDSWQSSMSHLLVRIDGLDVARDGSKFFSIDMNAVKIIWKNCSSVQSVVLNVFEINLPIDTYIQTSSTAIF